MLVYVNKVYIEEDIISYMQIILHDEVKLKNIYYTDEYNKVVKYCRDLKSQGHFVQPLKGDSFRLYEGVRKIKIDRMTKVKVGFSEEDFINTVYGLYSTLARCGAVLMSDEYPYEDGYVGLVSEFSNINISNKNMEVTLPIIYDDNKVGSYKLISQDGDIIYNNKFNVAVPATSVERVYKYGLMEVGKIKLNNLDFIVLSYLKDLTIFRVLDFVEVPEPIIVKYVNNHELYHNIILIIKNILMKHDLSVIKFEESKLTFSDLFNSYSGVFFRGGFSMSAKDLEKVTNLVMEIGPTVMGKSEVKDSALAKGTVKILNDMGLDVNYSQFMLIILKIYKISSDELELVNSLMVNYSTLKILLLETDLYLYNLRLNIYNNSKVLYPDTSVVNLLSDNNSVRMEVWKK